MEKKMRQVLPFEQSGDFYHRRAVMKADRQSYLDAVGFLRMAIEREPDNSEYRLDLADVFARMCCYDESNRALVSIMRLGEATPECFFGLGCNFYALREFDSAREAFMTYRRLEPEGEFSETVEDMLYELEDEDEDGVGQDVWECIERGKRALEEGDHHLAVRLFSSALAREPHLTFARNDLALAAFCAGDGARALKESRRVLEEDPDNLHAHCNMAIFLAGRGQKKRAARHLEAAMEAPMEELDDMYKMCLTLCELGRDEEARAHLKKFLNLRPYDKRALHYYAVANFNLKKYDEAAKIWRRVRRIAPESAVASYCLQKTAKAASGEEEYQRMPYYDQLPVHEVRRRVNEFSRRLKGDRDDVAGRFNQDREFRELVTWGLEVADDGFRRMALKLLTVVGGPAAEEMLRDFLLRANEREDLKREAMGCLKQIGAREPYLAMLGGAVVEVRVSVMRSDRMFTPGQQDVMRLAFGGLPQEVIEGKMPREEAAARLFGLWAQFLQNRDKVLRVRKPEGWAAALLVLFCEREGLPAPLAMVATALGTTPRAANACYAEIKRELAKGDDDGGN